MVQTRSVKRRRAGRKRTSGRRFGTGKLKLNGVPERGWANMNVVLVARCIHRGWRVTEDNLQAMRDPLNGHVLGKLYLAKAISERQFDAGTKYGAIYLAWARATGMPRITAPACSYGLRIPGRSEVPDDVAMAAEGAYRGASAALIVAGMLAECQVKQVVLENTQPDIMDRFVAGLDELVAHFG